MISLKGKKTGGWSRQRERHVHRPEGEGFCVCVSSLAKICTCDLPIGFTIKPSLSPKAKDIGSLGFLSGMTFWVALV